MPIQSFPSERFPGYPGVSLEVDDSWSAVDADGSVLTIVKTVDPGSFIPNVVVAIRRVVGTADPDAVLAETREAYAQSTESEIAVEGSVDSSAFPARHIEASFVDPAAGTLAQSTLIACVPRGAYTDIVQVTGTCSAVQIGDEFEAIRDIVRGATITA